MRTRQTRPNKLALRVLSTAAFLTMAASCAAPVFADAYGIALYGTYDVTHGSVTVNGNHVTYYEEDGTLKEKDDTDDEIIITGRTTENTVTITNSTVTISDLNIDLSGQEGKAALATRNNVTIELDGNNTLISGKGHAGLERGNDSGQKGALTIRDETNNGTLLARGGEGGAGIGGHYSNTGTDADGTGYTENITITGGTITAEGGKGSAGIGGGRANSENFIEKDRGGNAADITITGKNTKVTAKGGEGGAGVGGGQSDNGFYSGQAKNIIIKDGAHVEATGGKGAAGIGGGSSDTNSNETGLGSRFTISGDGTYVEATGSEGGAGIGGGKNGQGQRVTIRDDVTVVANGSGGGAGIGGGENLRGCNIFIHGGRVKATGGSKGGSGIGGGKGASSTTQTGVNGVTITGGSVTANGGKGAAGIGSGAGNTYSKGSYVSISGGSVNATGGKGAAGIGDGVNNKSTTGSNISITGGSVNATGGKGSAAGIGNGENDAVNAAVTLSATDDALNVTAVTRGTGEAITGETTNVTMEKLGNLLSGVVRAFRGKKNYRTVHNGRYLGMDTNADEHLKTDAHVWGRTTIVKRAAPDQPGTLRHHCAVAGCNGYYEEAYDYVEPENSEAREVGVIFWDAADHAAAPEHLQGRVVSVAEDAATVEKAQVQALLTDPEHWQLAEEVGDLTIHPAADAVGTIYEQAVRDSGFSYYVVANVAARP